MTDFDSDDCLKRYLELARTNPSLIHNPPGKIYEILSDPLEARHAAAATREQRLHSHGSARDTRIGVLAEDPYVTVIRDSVRFPDGSYGLYYRLVLGAGFVVLPVLRGSLVLVKAFRHGTRRWHLEAPRGMIEGPDPILDQVARELSEEIGARPVTIVGLGEIHPSPGVVAERLTMFVAEIDAVGEVDRHEAIDEIHVVTPEEFETMVREGAVTDGPTLSIYLCSKLRGAI